MTRLPIGETFGDTFGLVFRNLPRFLATQDVFVLASAGLLLALDLMFLPFAPALEALAEDAADPDAVLAALALMLPTLLVGFGVWLAAMALSLLGSAVGITVTDALLRGEAPSLGEAWSRTAPRALNYVATMAILVLAVIGVVVAGAVLISLVVPLLVALVLAVFLVVRWAVAGPAALLERNSPGDNLRRSWTLVRGSTLPVLVVFLLMFLVAAAVQVVAIVPFAAPFVVSPEGAVTPPPSSPVYVVAEGILGAAVQLVTLPLVTALGVLVYRRLQRPTPQEAPPVVPAPPAGP